VEREGGENTVIQLLEGVPQRGALRQANESLHYKFTLPANYDEKVQISLESDNGDLTFYVTQPDDPDSTSFRGDSTHSVVFHHSVNRKITYNIRVAARPSNDKSPMSYSFKISFHESRNLIRLSEGQVVRGRVHGNFTAYYSFECDVASGRDYEVTVTPIGGNPDLAISYDPYNQFPSREDNNFISENAFFKDTVILRHADLKQLARKKNGELKIFIAVYTNEEQPSVYTLVVTAANDFTPILLKAGQAQSGTVSKESPKYYYFKASGDD